MDGEMIGTDGVPLLIPPFNKNSTTLCNDMGPLRYLVMMIGALLLFIEVFGISVASAIFIILRRNSKSFTTQTRRMHVQLTALLVMQLLSPLVCMVFPVIRGLSEYLSAATNCSNSPLNQTTSDVNVLSFSLYGFSNTALTILFITPYRRHLFGTVLKIRAFGTISVGYGSSSTPHRRDVWN
ncbi:hypothetical protein AAVH_34174 [Aphelenchoides avenae]|nr:hypothetical protein AAVH_34174 [Aphelenchus avenae]